MLPLKIHMRRSPTVAIAWVARAALCLMVSTQPAVAEDSAVARELNRQFKDVTAKNRTSGAILAAFLKMTPPPFEVGDDFDQGTIWPKMEGWPKVSAWAKSNAAMGQALVDSQFGLVFGLGYGDGAVDGAIAKAGLQIKLGDGADVAQIQYGYFRAIRTIGAFATAEMYRLGAVEEIVPVGEAETKAVEIAADFATKSPIGLRLAKESILRIEGEELEERYRTEQDYTIRIRGYNDSQEAMRAYLEKRDPNWTWS